MAAQETPALDSVKILKSKPTEEEVKALNRIARPGLTIDVVIPEDIDAATLWFDITITAKELARANAKVELLKPVLGKLLLVAQRHPELWQERFENYEDLVGAVEAQFGVGRSTCYEVRKMVEKWEPAKLDIATFGEIPRMNWRLLDKVVPDDAVKQKWAMGLVEKASAMRPRDFKKHLEAKDYLQVGESEEHVGAQILISCSKRLLKDWNRFIEDPDIQGHVGSADPGKILDAMIAEVSIEWKARVQEVEGS